jgi:hypothetical protein
MALSSDESIEWKWSDRELWNDPCYVISDQGFIRFWLQNPNLNSEPVALYRSVRVNYLAFI